MKQNLNTEIKKLRSKVIEDFLINAGIDNAICFSSGNCAKYLKKTKINVLAIINPPEWYSQERIKKFGLFDASSGNIPLHLINRIAKEFRNKSHKTKKRLYFSGCSIKVKNNTIKLPTGSGECFMVIKIAYPNLKIIPIYNTSKSTEYNSEAPLNNLVNILKHESPKGAEKNDSNENLVQTQAKGKKTKISPLSARNN